MSNSAMLTAKKRAEANLRNVNLPTDPQPSSGSDTKNGALLISLLQSRLNWCNCIFPKYRHDSIQQPRRTNNMRRKWPNMRYLGSCTVHLGVHSFPETSFYEAIRTEPWTQLAKEAGFMDEITDVANNDVDNSNNDNKSGNVVDGDGDTIMQEQEQQKQQQQKQQQQKQQGNNCVFTDLVMEFKENTSDRFIFPKEAITEVMSSSSSSSCDASPPFQLTVSFLLPLAVEEEDGFFRDPKEKLALWGHQSNSETIRNFAATLDKPNRDNDNAVVVKEEEGGNASTIKPSPTQQPVNMRLSQVEEPLLNAIRTTVKPLEVVRDRMMARLETLPTRTFLQYHTAMDKTLTELLQKATSFPDIVHGPVTAEKKRNELLNAIQLGKRPRTDEELPKSKSANVKDDGLRKCAYCSAKTTAMWRPGPAGSGTLCNGCGLLWSQGKILKDAPVISKEEEKKRAREERERRREEQEIEIENQRQKELMEQQQQSSKKATSNHKVGMYAAQLLQQQEQQRAPAEQSQQQLPPPPLPPQQQQQGHQPQVQPQQQQTTTATKSESKPQPSLYSNPAGIPLPTLSIDFGPSFFFVHPACSVALVEGFFSIRLVKDGFPPVVLLMDKKQLQSSTFQVTQESQLREVLVMTVIPTEGPTIHHFNTDLLIPGDKTKSMKIRFLEKSDAGGAVVQRILERWIATPSPTPSAAVAAAAAAATTAITAASAPASSSSSSSSSSQCKTA